MPTFHRHRHSASDEAPTATRRAYEVLKQEVLTCQLAPGAEIHEGEIAERLEMSKTPVREALSMLVHEGLVDVKPRQGYRVTEVTVSDIQEVFHMRLLLEPAAAELAAERATPEELAKLQDLAARLPDAEFDEQVAIHTEFHETVADASRNERLAATLRNLLEEVNRFLYLGLGLESFVTDHAEGHAELLNALLRGNHHLAREIAVRQVEEGRLNVFQGILDTLAGSPATGSTVVLKPPASDG